VYAIAAQSNPNATVSAPLTAANWIPQPRRFNMRADSSGTFASWHFTTLGFVRTGVGAAANCHAPQGIAIGAPETKSKVRFVWTGDTAGQGFGEALFEQTLEAC
jgi:hypothetical protein